MLPVSTRAKVEVGVLCKVWPAAAGLNPFSARSATLSLFSKYGGLARLRFGFTLAFEDAGGEPPLPLLARAADGAPQLQRDARNATSTQSRDEGFVRR